MTRTQQAVRNFLRGLVADGKNAQGAGTISDLIDWHEANGRAAAALLLDLTEEEIARKRLTASQKKGARR